MKLTLALSCGVGTERAIVAPPPNPDYSRTFVHLVSTFCNARSPTIGYDVSLRLQTGNASINRYTTFFVSCHYHGNIRFDRFLNKASLSNKSKQN